MTFLKNNHIYYTTKQADNTIAEGSCIKKLTITFVFKTKKAAC